MDVFKLAAARPSGILALLFFHRNVATSGPNILVMVHLINDAFCEHLIGVLFA